MHDGGADAGTAVAGVLFDMGGTVFGYESRALMGRANEAALRRLGLDPDHAEVREARRIASEEVSRAYAARPSFLHRELFRDRVRRTAELLGVDVGDEVLDRFDVENVEAILEHMIPRADAAATLRALGDRGIYRAIVSNADDAWVEPALARHGLLDLFEHWTSSEEAGSCKPDVGIFDHALAKAGLDRSVVLFVGDSVAHDIVGAHAAGMRAVLISDDDAPAPLSAGLALDAEPDHRIESLGELVGIVDESGGHR